MTKSEIPGWLDRTFSTARLGLGNPGVMPDLTARSKVLESGFLEPGFNQFHTIESDRVP